VPSIRSLKTTLIKRSHQNPTGNGNDQVSASLPAGTTCTGGASGDLCLVSFATTAGFGNCVVVQQGAGGGAGAGNAAGGAAAGQFCFADLG
jgi:hypothetical protein